MNRINEGGEEELKMAQFAEYADVARPGVRLVSATQVRTFLNDTTYGILLWVSVFAIDPSLIESIPNFRLKLTLGLTNQVSGITFPTVAPSQPPSGYDLPLVTKVTLPDGSEQTVNTSIDLISSFPLKALEGHLFFIIPKGATQRPIAHRLDILP